MNLCRQPHSGYLRRRIEKDNILLFESLIPSPCGYSPCIPLWEHPVKLRDTAGGEGDALIRSLCYGYFQPLRHFVLPPLSHVVRAQGRRLIPFCFPILPSLRVPSHYILFGDIYSIGLRETVREEFPLSRIILESCIYPSPLCGVSRIGETSKKQRFLRRGVGIYKDNLL